MTADLPESHRAAGWPRGTARGPLCLPGTEHSEVPAPARLVVTLSWWLAPAAVLAAVMPLRFTGSDVSLEEHLLDTRILEKKLHCWDLRMKIAVLLNKTSY